jgi:hypothetical protein
MPTRTSTRPRQASAYPYLNKQTSSVPLAQSDTNWSCTPMPRNTGTCTDQFATWRHDLSRSWIVPPQLAPYDHKLSHIPPMPLYCKFSISFATCWSVPPLTLKPSLDPASPSESSCSSISARTDPSPPPSQYTHVVCDVPLVVPKPRPYRSLTPIDFDLPSEDQDLSHPPYTTRSCSKRKRTNTDETTTERTKRRSLAEPSVMPASTSRPSQRSQSRFRNRPR